MILEKAREIRVLLLKHLRNELTPEEDNKLRRWIAESGDNRRLFEEISNEDSLQEMVKDYFEVRRRAAQRRRAAEVVIMPTRRRTWIRYVAAACMLMGLSLVGYVWFKTDTKQVTQTETTEKPIQPAIPPGKDGAILTLGDGTQIILDSVANGKLAQQGKATIIHKDGQISYRETGGQPEKVVYNTTSTPRGRQYKLLLSDGTAIWLNAASSVTYPTGFAGNKREISVTGEVYIEVARNKSKPFIVHVTNTNVDVEVLGTRFAVNSYPDEPYVKTTLLEGSIRLAAQVQGKNTTILLKPGEQTRVSHENLEVIKDADTEEATAFIHGFFSFRQSDIRAVMRQLEKWYDLQVTIDPSVSKRTFAGEIERNLPLPTVLKILERNGFRFTVDGTRVQVR